MSYTGSSGVCVCAFALWLAVSGSVMASGTLPVLPVTETLPDFAACLARLQAIAADDRAQVMARKLDEQGNSREVTLVTQGVLTTGQTSATYDATLWFHSGAPDATTGQFETSHSYQARQHRCDGPVLTSQGTDGYTLSTFDPPPG